MAFQSDGRRITTSARRATMRTKSAKIPVAELDDEYQGSKKVEVQRALSAAEKLLLCISGSE
jgi:hypothetical protein